MAARIQSLRNGIDPVNEASRDDLVIGDVVTVSSLDGATTYNWTLVYVPEGSTATFSGVPTAVSPGSFVIDKVGAYLVRLVVDQGLGSEDTQYVRLRALTTTLGLTLVAAGERRDGTGIIPVDVDATGWADEQNNNLLALEAAIAGAVGNLGILSYNKNIPEIPNDAVSYRAWAPVACRLIAVRARMMTLNTQGNYTLEVINEATGNTVLTAATFDMNGLTAGVVTPLGLTANPADLTFAALDEVRITLTSDDPDFDGSDIYIELVWNSATAGGPVVEDLATTLLVGNITGGTNIFVTAGDVIEWGDSPLAPVSDPNTGRIRYNQATMTFQTSADGGPWTDIGTGSGGGGTPFVHKNVPPLPNNTYRYEGWVPINAVATDISVAMATVNTQGNYTAVFTNETTGQTMLVGPSFDMNTLVAGTVTSLPLTGTLADLTFSAGDQWSVEMISDNLAFDGVGIYWSIQFGTAGSIVISGAPDDNEQFEMSVSPANTVNTLWFAPYNCEIVQIRAYAQTSPTTAGVYTLAVEDIDNTNNLLSAATFDMTGLVSATITDLTLTGTPANLLLNKGTRVRLQLVSDNGDLVAAGVYLQIIYRSQ
jgi:hypothetical protein